MAKSLSRILGQIERLQKEAAAIQTGVIARIRKEISDHGLTAEHLFGKSSGATVSDGSTPKFASAKKGLEKKTSKGASRPPKFADGNGNVWGGMGKRPEWVRSALAAGKALEDFLISNKKIRATAKKPKNISKASAKSTTKVAKRASSGEVKAAPKKTKGTRAATKPVARKTAKKTVVARKTPSKKKVAKTKQAAPAPVQGDSGAAA